MFTNCESLSKFPDISKWKAENLINISFMIKNCKSLIEVPGISSIYLAKVEGLFDGYDLIKSREG